MAPSLDCELGGVTANSYVCTDVAEAIANNLIGGDEWIALTTDEKELSLIQATMWLETLDYFGQRCAADQRLKWPRANATCDGVTATCTAIPYKVQEAEVLLAMQLAKNPEAILGENSGNAPSGTFVKRQKLGDLEIEYAQFNASIGNDCDDCDQSPILQEYPWLEAVLGCWVYVVSSSSGRVLTRQCCEQVSLSPSGVVTRNYMSPPPY